MTEKADKGVVQFDEALKQLHEGVKQALERFFAGSLVRQEAACLHCGLRRRVRILEIRYEDYGVPPEDTGWRVRLWQWLDEKGWTRVSGETAYVVCPECSVKKGLVRQLS